MAELVAKKASNVVSNNSKKKNSDVCSVQSNNGLIDLDNITASNNQLITLCDDPEDEDDIIITRNTKNELTADDKSLQEMIESELALRICSANETEESVNVDDEDEDETTNSQPEVAIKKIILEPRQDPMDINAEFIGAEMEHYTIVEDPYTYRNGHTRPGSGESRSPERPDNDRDELISTDKYEREEETFSGSQSIDEAIDEGRANAALVEDPVVSLEETEVVRPDEDVVEDEVLVESEKESVWSPSVDASRQNGSDDVSASEETVNRSPILLDKHREEEEDDREIAVDQTDLVDDGTNQVIEGTDQMENHFRDCRKNLDFTDLSLDPVAAEANNSQVGQFSDDFALPTGEEENLLELEEPEADQNRGSEVKSILPVDENFPDDKEASRNSLKDNRTVNDDSLIDIGISSGNNHETVADNNTADFDLVFEESEKTSESCVSADSSQIEVLPSSLADVNVNVERNSEEIGRTRFFIDEERKALQNEYHEAAQLDETSNDRDTAVGALKEGVKSYPEQNEELEESAESSWMTVEEATNDRNKLAEIINEHNNYPNETQGLDTNTNKTTSTTNATTHSVLTEPETNYVASTDNDERPFNNTTKIDNSCAQDTTITTTAAATRLLLSSNAAVAPLATPDDESSELSNVCDSESCEEVITSSSVVTSSSTTSTKSSTKTKKKKIEGVAGNDASPTLTPRTKKTKKSKKNDLEKENISVCRSFGDISNMTDVDQAGFAITEQTSETHEKSSFNKFDALSKKSVLHVRSVDAGKVQQQLNSVGQNGDANPNCRSCGKVVFQMEQTKAEGLVWHKNCFRCVQCSKQLNVDNYQSHESTLYCKAHFKELFQPKPVEESDQPASDKPDLGLEELSSLNVKSRFQVFEKSSSDTTNEIERSPSQVVKRSPSILSKLAKFQAKGMDIGVADDSLNGIPYEESSESEEEEEIDESEELDTEIIKAKRTTRERPISFTKMDDIKNRWECTSQQGRRESQREARKEEIAGIRSRLFMGKQGKMKEMYQQAVAESEKVTKTNPTEEIQHSTHARSIKERFERGEPIATSDGENETKPKQEKPDEEVIAAGISRKSRSLFLELDATAAKTGRPVTPVNPKTPTDVSRRARDIGSPEREIYRDPDVVRADDRVNEVVHTDTARKMLSIFRQMEEKATKEDIPDGPKPLKRFTPPPEDKFAKATASESDEEEDEEGEESDEDESGEERDPNYVRASDKVEDEFLKQAQNAARAKTLRAKFEHWETTDGKVTNHHVAEMDMAQGNGDQASIESASSLRARFESLGSQPSDAPRAPKVKVNRFVEIQTSCMDVCESCQKKVYPLEKVETNNKIFHKQCFRCLQCNCVLRMDTFTLNNGKLYCIPHFKQLFIARGNYDEGFGVDPHKNKWAAGNTNSNPAAQSAPIAVSNGRATSVVNRV